MTNETTRTAPAEPVRNEAAERLTLNQKLIRALHPQTDWNEYDREVRRATVERIAEQWDSWIVACAAGEMREMVVIQKMNHLLDEEAARG